MSLRCATIQAGATGRVATTGKPRAPASLGGSGMVVRRSAAPLHSEFLGTSSIHGLCSAVAGMALSPVKGVAVRLISPFMVECNTKKGKGATVAKTTNRKRARVSGFRMRLKTAGGRKVLKARRAKGRKSLAPASVFGGKHK